MILCERIGCLQNYILRKLQSFRLAAGDEPLPYNFEIDFYTKIIFPTNLSFAICLFYALCAKNKESVLLNHSSSLFNFLSRKLAGYGVEPRKKRKRAGVGLRYPSEPVQMRKKRTSTSSKRLIIFPYIISPLFLVSARFYESSTLNRIIFSFFKAAECRNTGSISSFANAERRKKNRFKAWFGWIS